MRRSFRSIGRFLGATTFLLVSAEAFAIPKVTTSKNLSVEQEKFINTHRNERSCPITRPDTATHHRTTVLGSSVENSYSTESSDLAWHQKLASSISQSANTKYAPTRHNKNPPGRGQLQTLLRVAIPSILAGVGAMLVFPAASLWVAGLVNDAGAFTVLSQDASQFVQNFLTVAGLLFSILVGQTCEYAEDMLGRIDVCWM